MRFKYQAPATNTNNYEKGCMLPIIIVTLQALLNQAADDLDGVASGIYVTVNSDQVRIHSINIY